MHRSRGGVICAFSSLGSDAFLAPVLLSVAEGIFRVNL
jgi:hypothetical protein